VHTCMRTILDKIQRLKFLLKQKTFFTFISNLSSLICYPYHQPFQCQAEISTVSYQAVVVVAGGGGDGVVVVGKKLVEGQ